MGLVGRAARIREEVLDGLAGAPRDVLERRQRRTRAAGLDQVDRGCGDVTLAELSEAQTGFHSSLLDGPQLEVYARQSPAPGWMSFGRLAGCTTPAFTHDGQLISNRLMTPAHLRAALKRSFQLVRSSTA